MRLDAFAFLLCVAAVRTAGAQVAIREYRPALIVTSPRVRGFGAQLLVEQHLATGNLAPNERTVGVGLVSPVFLHVRAALEARQVMQPTVLEHRYIPTIFSTVPLGGGFEARNRTRAEFRDVDRSWSHRWQHRSGIGHNLSIAGTELFPYGQIDLSFDSRFQTVNRTDKTVGFRVPVSGAANIDTFVTKQDDTRRSTRTLYVCGAHLRIAL